MSRLMVTIGGHKVRGGPGYGEPVVRELAAGDVVEATGEAEGGWLPVEGGFMRDVGLEPAPDDEKEDGNGD